jgi:hypothetical protein
MFSACDPEACQSKRVVRRKMWRSVLYVRERLHDRAVIDVDGGIS